MHLNRECRYPELGDLFSFEDYSTEIIPVLADIKSDIAALKKTLTQKVEPSVSIGNQCDKPRTCPFKVRCWGHIPELSIFNIPRNLKKWEQYEQGTISICSLNMSDFKSKTQQRALLCYKDQNPYFNPEIVAELLSEWKYPLSYLDFEAIDYAIPRFPGARPYQHVPFQFSCHMQRSPDAELEHTEFLWTAEDDPRPAFIQKLLNSVPAAGSVIVYSASYESTRLKELAEDFPEYRGAAHQHSRSLGRSKSRYSKGCILSRIHGKLQHQESRPGTSWRGRQLCEPCRQRRCRSNASLRPDGVSDRYLK